jgi:hypothetical protein
LLKDDGISKGEYIKKCKELFKETFKVKCNLYDCYYPSTFFEWEKILKNKLRKI